MLVALPASPFRGLTAYGDSPLDAMLFFGRARETEVIAANLQASRLTVLFGPTGVGKTSIVRAGVAQRLRQEPDVLVEIVDVWAGDAGAAIEEILGAAPTDRDLYLILDQFEEYFVYHEGDETLPRLLAALLGERGRRINVLIGIRDDALAQLDSFRALVPNLLGNRLALDRLHRDAGRAAILGPVARFNELSGANVEVEPELVETVLDEVTAGRLDLAHGGREADATTAAERIEAPYLQLVLERLWEAEREAGSAVLRLETLRRLGGSAHVVGEHLERAMDGLSPPEKEAAAAMYNHLVTPSGTKITHGVGDLARYANVPEPEAARVLDKLARERILRSSSDDGPASARYEIYHDVLADAVLEWHARHAAARAVAEADQRRRRAYRLAASALAALAVVAAIAIFALVERSHARTQTRHARAGQLVAEARTDLDVDPRNSIALALQAAQLERTTQVEDVLRDALIAARIRLVLGAPDPVVASSRRFFVVGDARGRVQVVGNDGVIASRMNLAAPVTSIAATTGGLVAAGTRDGRVVELGNGKVRSVGAPVTAVALASGRAAAGTGAGLVEVWKNRGAAKRLRVRGRVTSLSFSPNRRLLLVTSRDRRARLVDVATGRVAHTLAERGFINAAAFSPDGRVVVTASQDRTARFWNARTGRSLSATAPATGGLTAIAFSPDGKLVALGSSDAVARVYDSTSGAIRFYLSGDTNTITDLGFHPHGIALVTASADRTARIWTGDVGRQLVVLRGHTNTVERAFFTSDGRRVVTAGADGSVRVWDPGTEPELHVLVRQRVPFVRAIRRPDGTVAVTDSHGRTRVLDPRALRVLRELRTAPRGQSRAEAAHGDLLARARENGIVTLARRGHTLHRFSADADSLEFSPDGRLLASGGHDHYLRVWDVRSGRTLIAVTAHQGPVEDVSFSPDGRWLVTAGPISAGVWSVATGRELLLLHGPTLPLRVALFTRDGRTIVTAGDDGTIRTYDCVVCGTLSQLVHVGEQRLAQTRRR
jgi:WD40 repeat protein